MKTLGITLFIVLFSLGVKGANPGIDFVIADGMIYYGTGIHKGFANTKITTTEGETVKIPNHLIQSYRQNGHQYELLPLVNGKGDTVAMTYMELIATHNGSSLYRYCTNCNKYDPLSGEIAPINRIYRYYVLKNGRLRLLQDGSSTDNAMAYFNVRMRK